MPKLVDHELRQRDILDATRRVILDHGVGAATIRNIATEAGLSTGLLHHYFADKDSLLLALFESSNTTWDLRLRDCNDRHDAGLPALRALLEGAMPWDVEDRIHWVLWFGFPSSAPWQSAEHDYRSAQRDRFAGWRQLLHDNLQVAVANGDVVDGAATDSTIDRLVALVVGLGVESALLGVHKPRQDLIELIDDQLATLPRPQTGRAAR